MPCRFIKKDRLSLLDKGCINVSIIYTSLTGIIIKHSIDVALEDACKMERVISKESFEAIKKAYPVCSIYYKSRQTTSPSCLDLFMSISL